VNLESLLNRWRQALAARAAVLRVHEAIIYFDGPRTQWERAGRKQYFEEIAGGLRVPHLCTKFCRPQRNVHDYERRGEPLPGQEFMPEPHAEDIIQRRQFRSEFLARVWVIGRLRGFDHSKIVGEVRPL
jgi:hypothetical protein